MFTQLTAKRGPVWVNLSNATGMNAFQPNETNPIGKNETPTQIHFIGGPDAIVEETPREIGEAINEQSTPVHFIRAFNRQFQFTCLQILREIHAEREVYQADTPEQRQRLKEASKILTTIGTLVANSFSDYIQQQDEEEGSTT